MWKKAAEEVLTVPHAPDRYKTQKMCEKAVLEEPELLECCPDSYKFQGVCEGAIEENPRMFQF